MLTLDSNVAFRFRLVLLCLLCMFRMFQALMLSRSLRDQNDLYCQKLEKDLQSKSLRVEELQRRLRTSRKKRSDERSLRKTAEENAKKAQEDLSLLQKTRQDEINFFEAKARELFLRYRYCIRTTGGEPGLSVDYSPRSFLNWLEQEFSGLDSQMSTGRDFAAITAFKAICIGL